MGGGDNDGNNVPRSGHLNLDGVTLAVVTCVGVLVMEREPVGVTVGVPVCDDDILYVPDTVSVGIGVGVRDGVDVGDGVAVEVAVDVAVDVAHTSPLQTSQHIQVCIITPVQQHVF